MKKYLPFTHIAYLFDYSTQPESNQTVDKKNDTVFLYHNLKKFIGAHPNWSQNDVKQTEINKVFADSINVWKNQTSFLKGMEFKLDNVGEYKDNGNTVYGATFTKSSFESDDPAVSMDIMGIVNKSDIDKLTNGKHYLLKGELIKTLDRKPGFIVDYYELGAYRFKITAFHQTD